MRRMSLSGKRILLTGASSGIGRELARELAGRGARLMISARTGAALDELAGEVESAGGARPVEVVADLSVRGAPAALARRAVAELGEVDVVVNNAGVGCFGFQWNVGDREEAREVFETNFWSQLAIIAELLPSMRARGTGLIVNVSSLMQIRTWPGLGYYAASKAAVAAATETVRLELAGSGVRVMELLPGPVDTPFLAEAGVAPGAGRILARLPVGTPGAMAVAAADAMERGKARLVFPRKLAFARIFPGLVRWNASRAVRAAGGQIDREDGRVLRSGAYGSDLAREIRANWRAQVGD